MKAGVIFVEIADILDVTNEVFVVLKGAIMDPSIKYKLNPDITESQLKNIGFRHNRYKCWLYKDIIQLIIDIDIPNKWWGYQIWDTDLNMQYTPYYLRDYGINNVVKTIDRKINSIFKEFEKEQLLIVKRRNK